MPPPVTVRPDKGRSGLGWEKRKREVELSRRCRSHHPLPCPQEPSGADAVFSGRSASRRQQAACVKPPSSPRGGFRGGRETSRCPEGREAAGRPTAGYPAHREHVRACRRRDPRVSCPSGPPSRGTPPPRPAPRPRALRMPGRAGRGPSPGRKASAGDVGAGGGICRLHRAGAGSGGAESGARGSSGLDRGDGGGGPSAGGGR
ncbi:protein ABHD13 isoform X3 [Hippopotamus amphibius kiboko]|uniref:protein ABHD13 isoform X3 n=1 Tax=Hippopotamus amphibius kiboko TaxID=575201 RepID=UPI00259415D2|nr:protein ABHD13 isoform X3 [Hippopotamus amphibius kiboko]XP_057563389.1 protein ABHD13 isoform X3 [Hippopotamus amphibius kiboko]